MLLIKKNKEVRYKNMANDNIVRYEFFNGEPQIDFDNFTETIEGFKELYHNFLQKHNIEQSIDTKLYIAELKSGSAIIDVCNVITTNQDLLMPMVSLLPEFVKYLTEFSSFLRKDNTNKTITDYSKKEYTAFKQFNKSIVADRGAKQNIKLINKGTININISTNYQEACTESYNADECIKKIETEELIINFDKVQLFLYQSSQSKENKKFLATAGIIKELSDVPVVMELTDQLRNDILKEKENPMNFVYIVDGQVITKNGKIKEYKITKCHTKIKKEDLHLL